MKTNSRTKNAKLNIIFGYIAQIGVLFLSFIGRRIFLRYLSADYLGINGLYTNILTVLSLAELGLDTAVVYSLYKPVADNNAPLICSLLAFFKKLYFILAAGIFTVGIALIPFLHLLVDSDISHKDLIFFYILFLINTIASYFVAHKVALLSACQQQRVQRLVILSFNFVLQIVHIVVLIIFRNYYSYIIATVINTILINVTLGIITEKLHPNIFKVKEKVTFDKKPIVNRIFSTFLYRLGTVMINSTDNILISVLVSTLAVGLYSNYYVIIAAFNGFIAIISASLISGIGNLAAKESKKSQNDLFDMMVLFYHCAAALGFIGFALLFNDFITFWLGAQYLFDAKTVFIIAFNFYLVHSISPVWMFREANGLFENVRYLLLIRAGLNILFSIVLGKLVGVFGIFLATAISLLLTEFWYEPRIISREVLCRTQKIYWMKQLKYGIITAISFLLCWAVVKLLPQSVPMLILKICAVCLITVSMFVLCNLKTKELNKIKGYIFSGRKAK